jgi:hypothetical protein
MTRPQKPFAQLLAEADDFDGPSYHGRGPRSNVVWWDGVVLPMLQRRRRLALAGRIFMLKSVHDEMRYRDLLAKAQVAARARPAIVVLRGPRSIGQRPALTPTQEELLAAARRRATLALS